MDFGELLQKGAAAYAGNKSELARQLGQDGATIRKAFAHKQGLPDAACVKLAELIGVEWSVVIAARNEWTAKTEAERSLWGRLSRQAAAIAATALGVTLFVSAPSESVVAQGIQADQGAGIHIIHSWTARFMAWISRLQGRLGGRSFPALRPRWGFAGS